MNFAHLTSNMSPNMLYLTGSQQQKQKENTGGVQVGNGMGAGIPAHSHLPPLPNPLASKSHSQQNLLHHSNQLTSLNSPPQNGHQNGSNQPVAAPRQLIRDPNHQNNSRTPPRKGSFRLSFSRARKMLPLAELIVLNLGPRY